MPSWLTAGFLEELAQWALLGYILFRYQKRPRADPKNSLGQVSITRNHYH